jgi:DNA-binding IclR family transcriptional regulator
MKTSATKTEGNTPTLRLLGLLEVIAQRDRLITPQELIEETGLPKPTVHRMLQQLEAASILQRNGDNRHYSTGLRLRRLAENLLMNSTIHGGRHAVLSRLVAEIGESCNITALSGNQVLYLDRVETTAPLRFYLHPGSRVPVHCSATGKLFLSQMSPAQRRRLLAHSPLERFTDNTLTSPAALEAEIERIRCDGFAIDNEESLPDLLCVAVIVPSATGRSNLSVAAQAPITRLAPDKATSLLPALREAAHAIAAIDDGEADQTATARGNERQSESALPWADKGAEVRRRDRKKVYRSGGNRFLGTDFQKK